MQSSMPAERRVMRRTGENTTLQSSASFDIFSKVFSNFDSSNVSDLSIMKDDASGLVLTQQSDDPLLGLEMLCVVNKTNCKHTFELKIYCIDIFNCIRNGSIHKLAKMKYRL